VPTCIVWANLTPFSLKSGNKTWDDPIEYDDDGRYVSGCEDGGAVESFRRRLVYCVWSITNEIYQAASE
jgi:hypothetical protein